MTVCVEVQDFIGERRQKLSLPRSETIAQVRPQIIESLNLSDMDLGGEPTTWILYNKSEPTMPVLAESDIVGNVLQNGQTIEASPNIMAGRSKTL